VTKDFTKDFYEVIHRFKNDNVLVGIPAEKTQREITDDEENSGMTNAAILAINNFGDPAQNIPKRPVMEIGIRNAQDEIIEIFKACAKDALSRGLAAIRPAYEKAGIVASNSIKKAINSQEGIRKPEDSTIAARKARGFKGNKALIVTGQMRNAITYVVKGKY
jgi:hypothetical protein